MRLLFYILLLLPSSCSKAQNRLVVFGDSISYGYYSDISYPQLLANQFNLNLENHSVTSTTLDSPAQIGAIRSTQISAGDRILFSPGINDAYFHKAEPGYPATYESLLKEALDKFEASGGEAYVGEPLHTTNPQLETDSVIYAATIMQLLDRGNYRHVHFVSSREQFVPSANLMHDAVHPNTAGHFELYKIFKAVFH